MPVEGPVDGLDTALGASYLLQERCGRGASGEVWRAIDRRTDETVAAKLLRPEHVADRDLVGRFIRERSLLTGLRHPNVVAVRDLVAEGDRLAIVMDYVDGGSLREVLRDEGTLAPELAVDVTCAVLDGLASAHEQGLLHRDVKPDNALLSSSWRQLRPGDVKLSDFGIARIVSDRAGTTTGLLGTPEYMSPELLATGSCDLPADVYGVGIMLYELISGRTPFAGRGTDYTVAHRHVTSQPPVLPVPDRLWAVIARMLDKDPTKRPDAAAAAAALRKVRPGLAGVPALTAQPDPEDFDSARGPVTMVRGLSPAAPATDDDQVVDGEAPELGAPGQQTVVRALPRAPVAERPRRTTPETPARPWYRDPRVLMVSGGGVLLLAAVVLLVVVTGSHATKKPVQPGGGGTGQASLPASGSTATGLTVARQATYDSSTGTVKLTITYGTNNAPLSGPFLEVLPATGGGGCPGVSWEPAVAATANLAQITHLTTPCAYSIDLPTIPAHSNATITASLHLALTGSDPSSALSDYLTKVNAATDAALASRVVSTAYPVQRLTGIQVHTTSSTVPGKTLRVRLYPEWPSGTDTLDPMLDTGQLGGGSTVLKAVAGGSNGVRFSDGCSGGLLVQGLTVTARQVSGSPDCVLDVQVGNLDQLHTDPIFITNRGS